MFLHPCEFLRRQIVALELMELLGEMQFGLRTQRIEVTIPGVNRSEIVREKTSSTVNYTYDNT